MANDRWTIREFAKRVDVHIEGKLVRYPEYEYGKDGTRVYSDDRVNDAEGFCFWIRNGVVSIMPFDGSLYFCSDDYRKKSKNS